MAQVRHKKPRRDSQEGNKKRKRKKQFIRADEWRRRRCRPRRQRCRDANSRGNHNHVDSNDDDDVSVCVHDQRNVVATLDKKPSQQMRLPNKARQQERERETRREGNGSERKRDEAVQLRALSGPLSAWLARLGLWVLRWCLQRQPWGINNENMQAASAGAVADD